MQDKDHKLDEIAYRRMEGTINKSYPCGQFIALMDGQIVADAEDFDELHRRLKKAGRNPVQAFIVQAGHVYPERAVIFLAMMTR
jgi:hypothetical protein